MSLADQAWNSRARSGIVTCVIEPLDLMALMGPGGAPVEDVSPERFSQLLAQTIAHYDEAMERLVGAMLEPAAVARPQTVWHAHRNAELRDAFVREFPVYTSAEVAQLAGSRAANTHALANRWRTEGKVFTVSWGGSEAFPAFQFDSSGRPLPQISSVIEIFPKGSGGWEIAMWFVTPNSWLGSRRPVDLLSSEPAAVTLAARHHFESAQGF